jgi:hypothetical protein
MSIDRFLGHIIDYDPKTDVLMIKVDFLSYDKQQIIEDMFQNKTVFSFWFKKPFRRMKTYLQLKKYFQLLKQILINNEIDPVSDNIRTFDIEMKKSILPCKQMELNGNIIPVIPSKADLDIDTMKFLIQEVMERYGVE